MIVGVFAEWCFNVLVSGILSHVGDNTNMGEKIM